MNDLTTRQHSDALVIAADAACDVQNVFGICPDCNVDVDTDGNCECPSEQERWNRQCEEAEINEYEMEELRAEFGDEFDDDDEPWDGFRDDVEADADALASAGWGTDEDYGYFGGDDFGW